MWFVPYGTDTPKRLSLLARRPWRLHPQVRRGAPRLAGGLLSRFERGPRRGNVLRPWQIRAELVAPERAEADELALAELHLAADSAAVDTSALAARIAHSARASRPPCHCPARPAEALDADLRRTLRTP